MRHLCQEMLGFLPVVSMGYKIFAMAYMEPYIAKTKIVFRRMPRLPPHCGANVGELEGDCGARRLIA